MMKPGRNDPCSCGSGEKFKKCCGKVIPLLRAVAPPRPSGSLAAPGAPVVASGAAHARPGAPVVARSANRSCGDCTACCDGWLAGSINGHDMKPGTPCHYVRAGGCSIYDERPQSPCRNFSCAWVLGDSPFPDEFKPDRLGVIIVPIQWREHLAYLLVSAGREPDATLVAQMERFSMQSGRPFFYERAGQKIGFGPPLFQKDMLERAQAGLPMW